MTEWVSTPIKAVVTLNGDVLPETLAPDQEIHYVEISDVSEGAISWHDAIRFGDAPSRARRRIRNGDVIVSTVRTYLRAVAGVEQAPDDAIASTGFAVLRPKHVDGRFLEYSMLNRDVLDEIVARSVGVSYPAINASDLVAIKIPVPSREMQRAISDFLDRETAEIDTFIADQEELIALLTERRVATITHAVTKGLDPSVPMKNSEIEWLGSIPAHWEMTKVKRQGRSIIGLTYSPDDVTFDDTSTIVLRSGNIQQGRVDISSDVVRVACPIHRDLRTQVGDILICARNGSRALVGKSALIDELASGQTFGAFMSVLRSRDYRFMSWVLNSSLFSSQMGLFATSTVNQLTKSTLDNFDIPWPPHEERQSISSHLDHETAELDAAIADAREAIALSKERRAALISAAVTGKIDVRGAV